MKRYLFFVIIVVSFVSIVFFYGAKQSGDKKFNAIIKGKSEICVDNIIYYNKSNCFDILSRSPIAVSIKDGDYDKFLDNVKKYNDYYEKNKDILFLISSYFIQNSIDNVLIFDFFLKNGMDANLKELNSLTLLENAIKKRDVFVVDVLLKNGADPLTEIMRVDNEIARLFMNSSKKIKVSQEVDERVLNRIEDLLKEKVGYELWEKIKLRRIQLNVELKNLLPKMEGSIEERVKKIEKSANEDLIRITKEK